MKINDAYKRIKNNLNSFVEETKDISFELKDKLLNFNKKHKFISKFLIGALMYSTAGVAMSADIGEYVSDNEDIAEWVGYSVRKGVDQVKQFTNDQNSDDQLFVHIDGVFDNGVDTSLLPENKLITVKRDDFDKSHVKSDIFYYNFEQFTIQHKIGSLKHDDNKSALVYAVLMTSSKAGMSNDETVDLISGVLDAKEYYENNNSYKGASLNNLLDHFESNVDYYQVLTTLKETVSNGTIDVKSLDSKKVFDISSTFEASMKYSFESSADYTKEITEKLKGDQSNKNMVTLSY